MGGFTTKEFRNALGHFATGITIVTGRDNYGKPVGFTANSFTSVSLEPPLVLVCADKKIASHQALLDTGAYSVHVLAADQGNLAWTFAKSDTDKFGMVSASQSEILQLPKLDRYLVMFECKVVNAVEGGDHTIFIGEVVNLEVASTDQPVLFFRGEIQKLSVSTAL